MIHFSALGAALAREGRPLVYGGGFTGLMGTVSAATLERGGNVIGVIPYAMYSSGGERDKALDDQKATNPSKSIQVPNPPNYAKVRYDHIFCLIFGFLNMIPTPQKITQLETVSKIYNFA